MISGAGTSGNAGWRVTMPGGQGVQIGDGNKQVNQFIETYVQVPVGSLPEESVALVVGDVPQEPLAFQHRQDLVAELAERGPGAPVVQTVLGMRGVGKTQVAAAYARQQITAGWRLVAWVDAGTTASVLTGLGAVATALKISLEGEDAVGVARRVRHRLEADGQRCLMVFDDAADLDGLRPFLPAAGDAHVVITSTRQAAVSLGRPVQVDVYTTAEALAFLADRTGLDDPAAGKKLAAELGWLPLGLAQAAAVIAAQKLGYSVYLERLKALRIGDYLGRVAGDPYPHRAAEAVVLSLNAADSTDASGACRAVMNLVAVLSAAGVPRPVLYEAGAAGVIPGCGGGDRSPSGLSAAGVDAALGRLTDGSLLTFSVDGGRVQAHRLVTRVIRERLTSEGRLVMVCEAAAKVLKEQSQSTWQIRRDRFAARDLVQQIMALYEHSIPGCDDSAAELAQSLLGLRMWALSFMIDLGDSAVQAVLTGEPLLADSERVLGADHLQTLNTGNNLATAYRAAGQTGEAIQLQERVVADCEQTLGPDHPNTLGYQSNLANAYQDAGRTNEAIALNEQVLAHREQILGADHPDTLTSRANLAASYQIAGRTGKAIPVNQQVLADQERTLGADHPSTLATRSNLANSYHQAGRIRQAITLHEQVLADQERTLGADHPNTLTTRINLANAYLDAGMADEAIPLHQRTLADFERVLGTRHPDTLVSRGNVANAYREVGRIGEAITLHEQVLADQEQILGTDHPTTMTSRANLAIAYREAGRADEGIRQLHRAIADRERVLGPEHPDTLNSRGDLANAYQTAGRDSEALPLYERVLADRERILGTNHPNTLSSRSNLAVAYLEAGRADEALPLLQSAVAGCEQTLGSDHPSTRNARQNLANARLRQSRQPG